MFVEIEPSFPYRDVKIKKNTDVKQFYDLQKEIGRYVTDVIRRVTNLLSVADIRW